LVLGVIVVAAGAAVLMWRLGFRDTETPVTPAEIVEDLTGIPAPEPTAASPSVTTAAPNVPGFIVGEAPGDPGLYVYATVGYEEIDALGGARHDYPAETFITLQSEGCGVRVRWTALEERWDEQLGCETDGGTSVAEYNAYHEWFSQPDLQLFVCGPADAVAIPTGTTGSWTYECTTAERREVFTVEVVGTETIVVNGTDLEAVHVRETSVLTGASTGSSETNSWYLAGTRLVLRRTVERSNVNDSLVGSVEYEERYEINIVSLRPEGARPGS
jgi:hypothetical protein